MSHIYSNSIQSVESFTNEKYARFRVAKEKENGIVELLEKSAVE
jgi:hypothetical protein